MSVPLKPEINYYVLYLKLWTSLSPNTVITPIPRILNVGVRRRGGYLMASGKGWLTSTKAGAATK